MKTAEQMEKEYIRIVGLKKTILVSESGGRKLFDVEFRQVWKNKFTEGGLFNQRFINSPNFEVKAKADVSGDPYAKGYFLIDKREQNAMRGKHET